MYVRQNRVLCTRNATVGSGNSLPPPGHPLAASTPPWASLWSHFGRRVAVFGYLRSLLWSALVPCRFSSLFFFEFRLSAARRTHDPIGKNHVILHVGMFSPCSVSITTLSHFCPVPCPLRRRSRLPWTPFLLSVCALRVPSGRLWLSCGRPWSSILFPFAVKAHPWAKILRPQPSILRPQPQPDLW